ncbi:SulP family inorganic anion transporter [Desertimonas flava]|uniref:SulP family inorganic anion transporter n=1 Tax=Desertimonas flava TaxID=2064846 RepID=UPI000E345E90|nr:SulP family inorganic anion transporter [Desertimonas flava]
MSAPPAAPLFASLRGYRRRWLRADVVAGLTVWAVLVPESLAYASIAGVSPVVGLYAAPPALVLYAAFGSSRHLVVGPMSATAAMSAAAVADLTTGGPGEVLAFTAVLALVTGVLALAAGVLRLGFVANFISEPVLKGFVIGLALTIIVGQVPKLLGVEKESGNFFEQCWHLIGELGDTHGRSLAIGAVSFFVVIAVREWLPLVPGSLVAVVVGVVAVTLFGLDEHGVEIVGEIDSGLPALGWPDGSSLRDGLRATGAAAGIMLVAFVEGLGAAKAYAAREHDVIDPNRELIGLGAANLATGLGSGMVVNGSLSKTAVNGSAGARTQLSGLVAAGLTIVTLLFLTGLFEQLPEPTLAAIVIAAVIELVDVGALRGLYRLYTQDLGRIYGRAARPDFAAAIAALVGVLLFEALPGLALGVVVSLLLLLRRASAPHIAVLGRVPGTSDQFGDVDRHPDNRPVPGVVVLRVEAGLFFANTDSVRSAIKEAASRPDTRAVILDAGAVPSIDVTAVRMLSETAGDLERDGRRLVIAHDLGQVGDLLAIEADGDVPVHRTVTEAIDAVDGSSA